METQSSPPPESSTFPGTLAPASLAPGRPSQGLLTLVVQALLEDPATPVPSRWCPQSCPHHKPGCYIVGIWSSQGYQQHHSVGTQTHALWTWPCSDQREDKLDKGHLRSVGVAAFLVTGWLFCRVHTWRVDSCFTPPTGLQVLKKGKIQQVGLMVQKVEVCGQHLSKRFWWDGSKTSKEQCQSFLFFSKVVCVIVLLPISTNTSWFVPSAPPLAVGSSCFKGVVLRKLIWSHLHIQSQCELVGVYCTLRNMLAQHPSSNSSTTGSSSSSSVSAISSPPISPKSSSPAEGPSSPAEVGASLSPRVSPETFVVCALLWFGGIQLNLNFILSSFVEMLVGTPELPPPDT